MLLFCNFFFSFFFFAFFFFAFRRFWPRPRFFGLFSAFLGLSRPFAPSSFLGKVGTFQSEFLPIFYPRHGNVFGGAKANVISITRGFAHTNTSPQHFQANIFKPTFSQCLLLSSLQHFHTGMPAFFSFTCCNTTGLHTFCLLLELARTTSTIHPTSDLKILNPRLQIS